ncbi:MAG: serine/threonine protein kinase, partial [Nannocystaceae bacterium]|nr:serine/threonine protein kinase [Nannocystaceae bacterium]
EPIGSGGMARLYLARTTGLGGFEKRVVLKQIHPHLAQDAEFIARFIQEARLTATLEHPNIAAVYEVDVHEGIHFYAMEYVRGRDLRKVLRRAVEHKRALAVSEIVAIVSALCAGLHHAHGKRSAEGEPLGIVHRDVSPSNVLIGFEGAVKLTDFGVAKARIGMVTTDAGTLRGKIPYMSPEQCRGEALDRRSDVYAVGLLMWEMLTGVRLRREETEIAMIRTIADCDAPSPLALRADCPAALEKIVMQALERSAATRYQSAAALQTALDEFGRESKLGASASSVAGLMEELFGEELLETFPSRQQAAIGTGTRELATATLAPVGLEVETTFDEAPTRAVDLVAAGAADPVSQVETRRSRSGLAVGLSLGVLVVAGGL